MSLPVEWHELAQRFHHVVARLARRHELVVLAPRSHKRLVRERAVGELLKPWTREALPDGATLFSVATVPYYRRHPWLVRQQWASFPDRLTRAAAAAGGTFDLLWLADPGHGPLAERVPHRKLLYECVDDHQGFWPDAGLATQVRAQETALARRANLVVATAPALAARLSALNTRTVHVGNGVELARFAAVVNGPSLPRPAGLDGLSGPVVGFYGAIGAWVDLDLIAALARAHPAWSFVLIGPVSAPITELSGLPNVRLLPPVPYAQLPAYLAHAPVWLVPFVQSPMTMAVDPLKAYEYLAAGRLVVASPLPALAPLDGLLTTARGVDAWGAAIARALAAGPRDAEAMQPVWERLAARDWDAIASELDGLVTGLLA